MKPEDLDKIFNERLGKSHPMPSADLWSRLQDRIEEELPAKEEKKPILMWARTYATAAAVTVLLSAGVVFYNVQQNANTSSVREAEVAQAITEENVTNVAESDQWINKGIAATDAPEPATVTPDESMATVETAPEEASPVLTPAAKQEQKVEKKQPRSSMKFSKKLVAVKSAKTEKQEPVMVQTRTPETPVAFASVNANMNAAPVEIIIKRTVATSTPEVTATEEPVSEFNKKKSLVKNIFKQVRNLSNGEQVNLEAVGLQADRIALQTQIGKQKISKVINL